MKIASRFFSVLTYLVMAYTAFTAFICGVSLCPALNKIFSPGTSFIPDGTYAVYGYLIFFGTFGGFLAAIVLNIFKCKWSSFFVLTGTAIFRLYVAMLFFNRARQPLTDGVYVKHHVWIVLVAVFALLSTLCYKKYVKDERGVTFHKTEKDILSAKEKEAEDISIL